MDMLKRPDAAELTDTGRFYLQVGYNEIFELGQSAWSGAQYAPSDRVEKKKDESVAVLDPIGRVIRQLEIDRKKDSQVKKRKQLDSITEYLARLAEEEHIRVKPLWLPPMPPRPLVDELEARYPAEPGAPGVLNPLIGMVDDPMNQSQKGMYLPLTQEGNVIVYGAAGSGKTTFLTTMCYSLLKHFTPEEVNLYLLDFGSEVLKCFSEAPQVGDVLFSYEREKVVNLFRMLYSELERRKRVCSEYGGDFLAMLRSGEEKMPCVVVGIQNYSGFSENFDELEEQLSYLTREGTKYGIYFVITALTTNAVRYRMMQNFRQLFVLQLNDQSEYSGVLGSVGGLYPAKMKGRGIFKQDSVYEFQLAFVSESDPVMDAVRRYARQLREGWSGAAAPKVPILPETVDLDFVKDFVPKEAVAVYPVGVDKGTLQVCTYPFEKQMVTFLLSRSDASDFVGALCRVIAAGKIPLTVLDPGKNLGEPVVNARVITDGFDQEIGEWFRELVDRHNRWKDAREQNLPAPVFEKKILLVHGLAALRELLSPDALDKFKVFLEKCQPAFGVTFLFSAQPDQVSSFSFEPWFRALGTLNNGIWIGSGIADQYQLKIAKITNQLYEELEMNFGYVVTNGKPRLVKLLSDAKEESEDG